MRGLIRSMLAIAAMVGSFAAQGGSVEEFVSLYKRAVAPIQTPPDIGSLSKACEQKTAGGPQVTLFAFRSTPRQQKVGLAVFTDQPIADLSKVISLRVLFGPGPTARPGPGPTSLSWGYILDRNRDGKADYLMFLDGARPVAPEQFPADYPKGDAGLSHEQLKFLLDSSRMVFFHYADENFDGVVDTVVAPLASADRPIWVGGYGVLQSTKLDSNVDRDWAFVRDIAKPSGAVPRDGTAYVMQHTDKAMEGAAWLGAGTKLLGLINDAAAKCSLGRHDMMTD